MVTNNSENKKNKFLYKQIVEKISSQIFSGTLKPGEKLPAVRKFSKDLGLSKNTILNAYFELEKLGLIESKPQSGFFVRVKSDRILPEPEIITLASAIKKYESAELVSLVHELANVPNMVSFGAGVPSLDMLPTKKLNRILHSLVKSSETVGLDYEFPPGFYGLRREIAKHSLAWGKISAEDVIITSGATEAITFALRAIAKPGDTIIVESPSFYLLFQIIQNLGMKILEVPTHPKTGIDLSALKHALKNFKVSGCILYPTINSPLGSVMPMENRKNVYDFLISKNIPIIEGDVWGELYFNSPKPKPIKSFDEGGNVLYFSSFTKTGTPGYRIGWVIPGKYFNKVKELKYIFSVATSTLPQKVLAEHMKSGNYQRGINDLKKIYSSRLSILSDYVAKYFPDETKMAKPQGGAFLWIELPKKINSTQLQKEALKRNISFAPGPIFSSTTNFSNYIRLSTACKWIPYEIEKAVKILGEITTELT